MPASRRPRACSTATSARTSTAARDAGDGRYQLVLGVENSSAYLGGPLADANATGSPLFRRFDTNLDPVMRDGQTIQTIASTDPVTGEVVKIDVTLTVIK